ncbi:hypothetical protein TRVL_05593 [Trypanosoma vivax]|uniref:Ubiquitin-like domain-containing protein n=1 Tax=Trypanosoma vivax (strain Y486) TaxID=1055687 RepID=G0U3U1_TRYVY|nr:hypothetical protein TRVL_05593 [Trypanosoma vivax]CCC50181.1 conserved hypothetical protein [Trypanosoma vivax Y486]
MVLRRLQHTSPICSWYRHGMRFLSVTSEVRDGLTRQLGALKEECKGQGLDLADMLEASRVVMRSLQEALKRANVDDEQFKGKCATLNASLKAYTVRMSNLHNEAHSIQSGADALLKLLWGTETPTRGASFSSPPNIPEGQTKATPVTPNAEQGTDEFVVEPPPVAKLFENKAQAPERVEAEHVPVDAGRPVKTEKEKNPHIEEIEVETIEIETVEVESESNSVDSVAISDITRELYERGVNFSHCLEEKSLRQLYRDVLSGKVPSSVQAGRPSGGTSEYSPNSNQPRMPQPRQQSYNRQQAPPNTNEAGLANDPYPNAYRKMVDPMKHVWEIKREIAAEKGIDPQSVDLWSGKTKLEDHKLLYDYPTVQSYPIEVRQKGDVPR